MSKTQKFDQVRKVARIWSLVLIIFVLFILGGYAWSWLTTGTADPHEVENYPPIENIPPLFELLAVLGLAIAWRWEKVGGFITIASSLIVLPILLIHWPINQNFPRYLIAPYGTWLIIIIPGILFLICWYQSKND